MAEYLEGACRLIALRAETVDGRVIITLTRESGAMELPTRVVRAHLYTDAGVISAEGLSDRVQIVTLTP